MKLAGWNSTRRVKAKLQAALYFNKKRRETSGDLPPPEPEVPSNFADGYFLQDYTE